MDIRLYNIGEKVRLLRESKNLTQQELANKLDLSLSAISTLERNSRIPSLLTLVKLCEFFETSSDNLLSLNIKNNVDFDSLYREKLNDDLLDISDLKATDKNAIKVIIDSLKK